MPRLAYISKDFGAQSLLMIDRSNAICAEFAAAGINLTLRGLYYRLNMFGCYPDIRRIALNMAQVEQYNPPPNPAKLTDSRVGSYLEEFGDESWELDALDPVVLIALVQAEIESCRDEAQWDDDTAEQELQRSQLEAVRDRWSEVVALVGGE